MIKVDKLLKIVQLRDKLLADLHCKFGDKYPGFFEFWYNLAAVELMHAQKVKEIEESLRSNVSITLAHGDESLQNDNVAEGMEQFFGFLKANLDSYSFEDALRISYMLEKESLEYCQVDPKTIHDSAILDIFMRLEKKTRSRVESVVELAQEYGLNLDSEVELDFEMLTEKSLEPVPADNVVDREAMKVSVAEAMSMFEKVVTTINRPMGDLIKDSMRSSVEGLLEKNAQLRHELRVLTEAITIVAHNALEGYSEEGEEEEQVPESELLSKAYSAS